jgi:hypothetical protein
VTTPDLDELETLIPPADLPDDALCEVTAADLRALTALIPAAREIRDTFGTLDQPRWEEPCDATD